MRRKIYAGRVAADPLPPDIPRDLGPKITPYSTRYAYLLLRCGHVVEGHPLPRSYKMTDEFDCPECAMEIDPGPDLPDDMLEVIARNVLPRWP